MVQGGFIEIARLDDCRGTCSHWFPYGIGCGLAGGKMATYQAMIQEFAQDAPYRT